MNKTATILSIISSILSILTFSLILVAHSGSPVVKGFITTIFLLIFMLASIMLPAYLSQKEKSWPMRLIQSTIDSGYSKHYLKFFFLLSICLSMFVVYGIIVWNIFEIGLATFNYLFEAVTQNQLS